MTRGPRLSNPENCSCIFWVPTIPGHPEKCSCSFWIPTIPGHPEKCSCIFWIPTIPGHKDERPSGTAFRELRGGPPWIPDRPDQAAALASPALFRGTERRAGGG